MIRQPTIPKIQTPQIRISAFRFHIENGKLVCTMYKDFSVQEKMRSGCPSWAPYTFVKTAASPTLFFYDNGRRGKRTICSDI